MALPDVDSLKRTLKIEHSAEDALLAEQLVRAKGMVQGFIGAPIETDSGRIFYDEAQSQTGLAPKSLLIPETPVDVEDVEIEDCNGTAIDVDLLRINPETGVVRYLDGVTRFPFGPYKITAGIGMDALDKYATDLEPIISQAIIDTAADLYYRRNPGAVQESSVGVSRSYDPSGLPTRVAEALQLGVRRAP